MSTHASVPVVEVRIANHFQGKKNMTSSDEESPLRAPAFSKEEAPCSFDVLPTLGTNGDAECACQRLLDACDGVGSEARLEERGASVTHHNRLAEIDFDVGELLLGKEVHEERTDVGGIIARKGRWCDPDRFCQYISHLTRTVLENTPSSLRLPPVQRSSRR
jgi:hypothetical protein